MAVKQDLATPIQVEVVEAGLVEARLVDVTVEGA